MKKVYETPAMEYKEFSIEDVVTVSTLFLLGDNDNTTEEETDTSEWDYLFE
ncbi:MAG: hypothetical protein ACI4CT_08430 [Lachnospiraceae bacterium]